MITWRISEERTGSNQQLIRMLEYLEGDIAINIGINDDIAYKGGKFVSEFCEAVQVSFNATDTPLSE